MYNLLSTGVLHFIHHLGVFLVMLLIEFDAAVKVAFLFDEVETIATIKILRVWILYNFSGSVLVVAFKI